MLKIVVEQLKMVEQQLKIVVEQLRIVVEQRQTVYEEEKPPVGHLWQLWSTLASIQPTPSGFIVLQIDSNTVYLLW